MDSKSCNHTAKKRRVLFKSLNCTSYLQCCINKRDTRSQRSLRIDGNTKILRAHIIAQNPAGTFVYQCYIGYRYLTSDMPHLIHPQARATLIICWTTWLNEKKKKKSPVLTRSFKRFWSVSFSTSLVWSCSGTETVFFLLFIERLAPNTEQIMINITTIPLKIRCRCFPPSLHSFSVGLLAEILNHQYPSARFIHLKWTAKWLFNK